MIGAERAFNDSITREMPVKLAPTSVPISQGASTATGTKSFRPAAE